MSQRRERQRRRQRDISQSSQLQEQTSSQVTRPEREQPAQSTVAQLQDTFGNQFVLEALSQQAPQGPGAVAAEAIQLGLAGVDSQEQLPATGSMSVLRAQLHADLRAGTTGHPEAELERTIRRSGRPLPPAVQARMEAAFGHDFSHVRIHTDAAAARAAADIQARAFAVGADIYFGSGTFSPDSPQGQQILAHELAHVEQADQGRLPLAGDGLSISSPSDKAEVEAVARARVVTSHLNTLSPAELFVSGPPAMSATPFESGEQAPGAEASSAAAAVDAPVMRDARSTLSGLSRQLSERSSRRRDPSSRRSSAGSRQRQQPSGGRQQPADRQRQQSAPGQRQQRPERSQQRPEGQQRGTAPDASELLADALATAIVEIMPPELEGLPIPGLGEQAPERGERDSRGGGGRQARGGAPSGQRPEGGQPGTGQQRPGPGQQGRPDGEQQGPETELSPEERLERFVTGQIIEPAVAEVGLRPEHVQQALGVLRPSEQGRIRGRAQQRDLQGPDVLLGMVPEALDRAAPVLDQLRAEAGENVERPDPEQVARARTESPEALAATPPVVAPEPTPSTEPGPSAAPRTHTTPSAAAPAQQPARPAGELAPAEEAETVSEEQEEIEQLLEEAEQEADEAAAEAGENERAEPEAEPVPTGRGRVSSAQQSYEDQRDYLEAEIHKVEIDLEWNETDLGTTGGKLTGKQDRIGDTQALMDDNADRRDSRRELVEQKAERARTENKPPLPPDKDSQLRFHDLKAKRFPQEMKGYERDVKRLKDETDKLNAEQERLNELMTALQEELNALQPPSSGGGAQGPENVPKICEKLSEDITKKTTETQRTVDTLTRERDELTTRVETLTGTLTDLTVEYDTAYRDWQSTQDDIDAADATLASQQSTLATTDGTAGGQSVPTSAAGDNTCSAVSEERSGLEALLASLETAWRTEIPARRTETERQKTEAETQLRAKTTELTEAEEEIRLMELAVTTLEGGTLLYEQIAARFGLHARRYFYPPGHRPWNPEDEFRTEEQMEAERQLFAAQTEQNTENTETDNAIGPVSLTDATATDREHSGTDSDSATTPATQTAAQRREEQERQEQQQRDALMRDISAARNLPPDERARRMEALAAGQSPRKTPAQLASMFDDGVRDTATAIANANFTAPVQGTEEEIQRRATAAGVSVEALQRWSEEQVRQDHNARAARYLGVPAEQAQEAADRLATLGAERGLSGQEMLHHLAFVNPNDLANEPGLRDLARQVAEAARNDPEFSRGRPEGMSEAAWREQQTTAARERQSTIVDTRAIAASMNISFGEVDGYVASLASASGATPDQIRAQLKLGGPAEGQGQTMSPAAINAELQRIHLLPQADRAEALRGLTGQVPPQQLMGALLANGENGNGLVEGPVANQQLDARLDAIRAMPMQQQWEAYANLSRMTGMAPDTLMRAQRNRDTRDQALNGVSEIRSNGNLSPQERTRRLEELAERMNLTTQQLEAAYEQSVIATQAALARAAGRQVGQGPRRPGDPLTQNLFEGADPASLSPAAQAIRDLQAGNLSGNDAERKIQQVAELTGLDPADIRRFSAVATMEHNQREWSERIGGEGPEAARQLTTWAEQRGITPEEMLDHLRRLPPDQCPPEMREAQRNLRRWDRDHAGAEDQHSQDVDELARQRAAAGLHGNAVFVRIETNPANIDAIEDPTERAAARRRYERYIQRRDALINKLDETCVEDDDAIALLRQMTPAERAALMADPAAVDEDGYDIRQSFRNGVGGNELNSGMRLMDQANAYNTALASGVQERVQGATQDAIALERRTQETMAVANLLGTTTTTEGGTTSTTPLPVAEANARIDALAAANGWSREQTVRELRTAADPQALLRPLFTIQEVPITRGDGTPGTRTQPSQAFRQELTRVNALPPQERREALLRLQSISGLSDDQMRATQGELTVENHVVQTLHQARELPAEERARVLERLREQTGRSDTELEGIYTRIMAQDQAALAGAPQAQQHIQTLRDCPIGDLQTHAEEVSRQTGMPVDVVLRLAQADRSQQPGRSIETFVGTDNTAQESFRNEAYRRNMSAEEFADYLARSPVGELPPELRTLRQQVLDSGYQVQYTQSEQDQRRRALGDPNDPNYIRQRNILFNQLTHDCTDETILNALNAMTPAQRKMFFEEWEARRLAGGTIGGGDDAREMQPIEDQLRDALQGGDETRGIALLNASREFNPEASLELDVHEPRFTGLRNSLLREIQPPGQPDPDTVRYYFEQMTPAQRSQFLRDQDALINAATAEKRDGRRDDNEMPVRIDTLMRGDHGFQVMLQDAQRMNQDANTARLRDAGRTRALEVETRVRETDRAVAALNWQGDRNQAYELLQSMSRDNQLSNENMLRMLEGRELVDDTDQTPEYITRNLRTAPSERRRIAAREARQVPSQAERSAAQREARGETLAGYTLDSEQVSAHATQLRSFLDGEFPRPTPMQVAAMLQGCNPRELAELDRRLQPGGLAALTQTRRDANGRYLPRVYGPSAIEVASLQRRAADYNTIAREDALVLELSANDPRSQIDPSTPEGLAQRMAWARGLPPEQRVAELNRLQGQLRRDGPVDFGATIAQAYLGGTLGGSSQVMRPALLAQVQAAQNLPPSQRDAQLAMLARLSGHSEVRELEQAASRSQANLRALTEFQRVEDLPESERLAEINRICASSGMSEGELRLLLEQAENSGVLDRPVQELSDEAQVELDRIKDITDPDERRAALEALGRDFGLTTADMIAHLNQQAASARQESQRRVAAERQAEEIAEKIRGGDEDEIRAIMQRYGNDPENFQRILREYPGGVEALQRALRSEFGRNDPDNIDFLDMIDRAESFTPAPELPVGVDAAVSLELQDILRRFPETNDPDQQRDRDAALAEFKLMNGLSEAAFASVQAHAEHQRQVFDQDVERRKRMIEAEVNSLYVDDERMREIIMGSDPALLHALMERYPQLMRDALDGTGGDTYDDIDQQFAQTREVMGLPYQQRAGRIQEMRVEYKAARLQEEFDAWFWRDPGRVQELLADCSEEELRLLDQRFNGQLNAKIDEVMQPTIFQTLAVVAAFVISGPIAGFITAAYAFDTSNETELAAIKGNVNATRTNEDGSYPVDNAKVDAAVASLRDELDSTFWVSDNNLLAIMTSLNPRELMALREQIEGDGPNAIQVFGENGERLTFRQILEANMSGDTQAKAVALLADAEDAASGRNRREELQQSARDMAIKDRMDELARSPSNRGKSPEELYRMAMSDPAAIQAKTQEKIKKIQDGANSLFKAIDGWGDNEKDVLKTLAGLTPEEIDLVKIEYRRHFGKDLETQMREDMGLGDWDPSQGFEAGGFWESSFTDHNEGKIALMMMSREHRAEGVREFLLEYSDRACFEDEDLIFQTLENMSVEERTRIVTMPGGEEFLDRIKRDLGTHERAMVDALVAVNPETGKAEANKASVAAVKMKMAIHGSGDWWDFSSWGTDENDFLEQLDGLTPEEVQQAMAYYNANLSSGGSFQEEVMSDFGTGNAWRVIEAEMRGDKVEADVFRIEYAADGWGTDEKLIEQTLAAGREGRGGRGPDHLAAVRSGFDATFGGEGGKYADRGATGQSAMDIMLGEETQGMERVYFQQMAEKGKADDEITLLYAMQGWGTDEEKVKKVMADIGKKSPEERAAFAARFRQMSVDLLGVDQSLEEWIEGDFSGTEGFEMKLQLMGEPQTPEEYLERARMRYEFERGGLWNQLVGNVFMDGLEALGAHSNGSLLVKQMGDIEAMFGPDGKLKDPQKFDDLKELCAWEAQDAQRYRETRDKVADAVSNTIQVVGAVVVTVVTAGAGSGVLVAVIANLAVSLAATAVKAAMKGGGYGVEELGMDLANAAVSAAFAGVGALRAAGQAGAQGMIEAIKAGQKLTEIIAKQGVKGFLKEALLDLAEGGAEGLLKALVNSEGALAQGDGAFLEYLLKETAMGGIRKVATTAVGKGLGKTPLGKKLADMDAATQGTGALVNKGSAAAHLGLKYADSVLKGVVPTVLDHNKWEQWAKGEGFDFNLLKSLFLDKAIESIIEVGARRTSAYQKYWANKNLKKAQGESEELWAAYKLAKETYDDEAMIEQLFGPKLEANQQAIMIGEQNLKQLNRQIAAENEQAIAQHQQNVQRVSDELDNEGNRRLSDNPEGDAATQDAMRQVARRMVDDAETVADDLAQGRRPADRRRGDPDLDDGGDAVVVRRIIEVGDEDQDSAPIKPKRTIPAAEADEIEASQKTTTRRKPIEQEIDEVGDGPERWAAFRNFGELAQEKAAIIGAKALGDDGEFSPALKAKLAKLGYTVRKDNVIARQDTGEQVPLHLEDGRIVPGLKVQGKSKSPTHLANELLPGGSRGAVWKAARGMIDQEIVLNDGRKVKVTRVLPTVVREGVDSEGAAIVGRRIALQTDDGQIVYRPLSDFEGAASTTQRVGKTTVHKPGEALDPAPVVKALEGGDTAALTGGDPAAATQVFSTPAVRKAVNQAFVDLPDSPAGRLRQVKTLMDSFGGDFEAAHQAFSGPESHAVRKAINAHRGKLVGGLIAEVQEAFPGLRVNARRLDPNAPTLSFEFEGAQTAHARAFLEQAAMELFGGSLKQKLGVELSEAPVRLRAEADVDGAATPRKVAGEFNDPISYEQDGVTQYFSDGKGGKWGYSTAFGFAGDIDSDGAFVIKQKVVLVADDIEDAGVKRVMDDVQAANATYYNDPKHRIVVDDVERPLRQVLDVEIISSAEAAKRQASKQAAANEAAARGEAQDPGIDPVMINVHKGKGRADSSNLYTEGPESPATDQYRQMVIAHELAHAIWGLADRYEDYPQQVKNPAYDPTRDPPDKEFINIRSEARKGSGALHVSREGGLMEDFNVAFVQGKVPLEAAKSWDDLGAENWQGLQSIYEASNKAVPVKSDGSYDWGLALKRLNTSLADERGDFPTTVPAGAEVVLPKLTAPKGWGVSSGNLKQLEWTIGQAKRGRVAFELGDGSEVDRVVQAEKGQAFAQPKQEYSKRVVDRAKQLGYDLDALSPSAISATRGRGKQRRSETESAKAIGGELGGGKTAILPAVGAKTSKVALAPDADVMAPEGARASRQPSNKTGKTVLPPSKLEGAKRTVDLARSTNKDLEALGLSKREITAIRKQTRGSDDFDLESFVKANPKLSSGSLGKIARLTGNEDAAVALMRAHGESEAETAHRLGLDHTKYGTQRSVEDVAELHNHFKGVLDPEDYPRLLFPAEHASDPDVAAKLTLKQLRQFYDENFDEVAFDPKTKAPKVSAELVQKIINGPDADVNPMATLRRVMRASAEMPFDYTYDPRGAFIKHIQAADKAAGLKGDKARMYQFVEATVERLAKQGIRYVELQGKLNAPGISDADFEAITAKHGIFVRMLPHLLTNQMAVDKEGAPTGRPISKEQVYRMLGKDPDSDEPISKIVAGLDICGPEKGRWSKDTIGQVDIALEALALESDRAGRPMVLRPHVGEGYSENAEVRRHGGGDRGEVAQISRNNLKVLLDHLEASPHYKPPPEGKVVVRLGHVTHATDKQIEQMRKLGVIAEVNIGSNLATGSLPRDTNANGRLDEHPLLKLMIAGVKTTLSTDAQGVMSTSMGREFGFADDMIQDFVSGRTAVTIRGKTLRFEDLSPEQQRRVSLGTLHSEGMEQVKRGMIGADILDSRGEIKPGAKHMLNKLGYEYDAPTRRIVPVAKSDLEPLAIHGRTLVSAKGVIDDSLEAPAPKLAPPAPGQKRPPPAPAGKRPPAPKGPALKGAVETDEAKGALKLSELELTGPTPGKRVTDPEAGETPLIGLANRTFDPELTATELATEIRKQGVPRQRRLTGAERKEESEFASMVEADPEAFVRKALAFAQESGDPDSPTFEVDGMKRLMPAYGAGGKPADDAQREYRLTMNHALHPTAVAIARMAFIARLDQLEALPAGDPRKQVFITNGGCGAGKSDLSKIVKDRMGPNTRFGAVWDAAGEGDALETSWILQAAQARGLKTVVGYAEADPEQRFEGVLDRAASKARVVDVMTFVNSYADGQAEMKRFLSSPEFEAARKAGMVEAYGILPGQVHPTKFKLGDAGKHLPTFPWLEDLNPQGGQLRAQDVGRLPTHKEKALKASLKTLEDYVQKQYEAGKDPSTVVKGALGNALKFLPEQSPEIQEAILDTHDRIRRILDGKATVERKPATLKDHDSVLSPALERLMELDFDTVKKITEDYSDFLDNKPSHLPDRRSGEVFSEMVGQAAVKPLPHVDIEDDGSMAYMEKGRKEYARYKQKAIVEGMDDDSVIMLRDRPEGAQDFDGLVPQKSGKVKDTDILFKYADGRRIITDPEGNITTVLSDYDIADYRVKGQWAGDATLEGESGAGSRINQNLGVDGIQHGMLTRGLSHPDKARKVIEKLAKPDASGKFTDPGRVIDMLRAEVYVFEKSADHKGFRAAMPMVEALRRFNPEAYATLAKVLPPELAEPAGITPQRLSPGETEALQLAEQALRAPPPGLGPKAPNAPAAPKAPRGPAGWDDQLEITAPIPGSRKAAPRGEALEVTADLPGVTPRRGRHDDITADLPAPSRHGPRADAQDVETFRRSNMNYDFYQEDVDRLLRKRPELRELMDEHGLSYEEVVAVYAYSRQDYADINAGLRGQEPEQLAAYRAQIAVTNSALAKLPAARGSVFRRVSAGDWLDEYQEGATVTERAYTSTSNDFDTMLGHAGKGSVEFVIRSRTGRDITQLSGKGELENEVLFTPGTRFRVQSRKVDADGTVVIYMDEEIRVAAPAAGELAPQAPGGQGKGAAKKRRRKQERARQQAQQESAPQEQTARRQGGRQRTQPERKAPVGELDLDTADLAELKAHGLSAKEARKIISFREQEGSFDFATFAALHPDFDAGVVAKAARSSGREAEAVAALRKDGEHEAEAAQRVGIDPRDFGRKVDIRGVAELHNHFKGILEADDFPRLLFPDIADETEAAARTVDMLRRLYQEDPDQELRLPHKRQATELIERILHSSEADSDPVHTLRRVMTAGNEMPFDFTYDPRGLLIDSIKRQSPEGAEAFVRATAKRLADQGITYAELQGKISTPGVDQDKFQEICAEFGVKIRLLPQLLTHQFSGDEAAGFTDDKLMRLMFGDDYSHARKVPDLVGGVDICGPEAGRWSSKGMDHLERAYELLEAEAQLSGRQLVLRPHVGEGYSGTSGQRRLGVEDNAAQAQTARHNLDMILGRLEQMGYEPPPAGKVQIRLGHVTAATAEQAKKMAALGVIAEVNIGSNMVTGALRRGKGAEGDRLDEHPLPTLLYYGVKTVLSTDAQGVMATNLPKEYGFADTIIQRFRAGEGRITVPDPDNPGDRKVLAWKDLTPEQQERFDVEWLARQARNEASVGRWDGGHRGPTTGLKVRRAKLNYKRADWLRTSTLHGSALRSTEGPNQRESLSGDRLREELARNRGDAPALMEELLKRQPPDAPRGAVVMNLIQASGIAFEDLMAAVSASGSEDLSGAMQDFQEQLVDFLERELRKHHPNTRIRAAGKGSSRMELVVEGAEEREAKSTLEQLCEHSYGRDWERTLGVRVREPAQPAR
jgi:hypothetical protein